MGEALVLRDVGTPPHVDVSCGEKQEMAKVGP